MNKNEIANIKKAYDYLIDQLKEDEGYHDNNRLFAWNSILEDSKGNYCDALRDIIDLIYNEIFYHRNENEKRFLNKITGCEIVCDGLIMTNPRVAYIITYKDETKEEELEMKCVLYYDETKAGNIRVYDDEYKKHKVIRVNKNMSVYEIDSNLINYDIETRKCTVYDPNNDETITGILDEYNCITLDEYGCVTLGL